MLWCLQDAVRTLPFVAVVATRISRPTIVSVAVVIDFVVVAVVVVGVIVVVQTSIDGDPLVLLLLILTIPLIQSSLSPLLLLWTS